MACQVPNGQFCCFHSPLYVADTSKSCSYTLVLNDKTKIKSFYILFVINQMQDEAININDNFGAISTLQDDKKLCLTCLQFSYTIKLHFPYDIIYLPGSCKANAASFVLLSNSKLHVESSIGTPQYKPGFKRSYSKISNFSLMQSLNLLHLMDDKQQNIANKIPEMKQMLIFSMNSTLTELRTYPSNFWSSMKVKYFQP